MSKRLNSLTFIDGKHCLTETDYKGYKIYKVSSKGLEYYSIFIDNKLNGTFWKLKHAKDEVDKL